MNEKITKIALIALGANQTSPVGSPVETLHASIKALAENNIRLTKISRFFSTPCFPAGAGPDYINAAISVNCEQSPEDLLEVLHKIEAHFARERSERWGQRTLDLDLLAVGDLIVPNAKMQVTWRRLPLERQKTETPEELILPHPRIQDRAFVLVPLADVAPSWVHPLIGLDVQAMCAALPAKERAQVVAL